MKKILEILAKPSRLVFLVAALVYAALYAVVGFGSMGNEFLEVLANIILMVLLLVAYVGAPVLLLLNKEKEAKIVFTVVGSYLLFTMVQNYLSMATFTGVSDGLYVTTGVLGFIAGLLITASLVLMVLSLILKRELFKLLSLMCFVGSYVFIFVTEILLIAVSAKYDLGWVNFVQAFMGLVLPASLLFGYLYFIGVPNADIEIK